MAATEANAKPVDIARHNKFIVTLPQCWSLERLLSA